MSHHRRPWTALLVATLSSGLIACSSASTSAPSGSSVPVTSASVESETSGATPATIASATTELPSTESSAPASVAPSADVSVLAAAGMSIVDSEDHPVDPAVTDSGHTMITMVQARRMVADVSPESGVLGADIDIMVPLPPDLPPMSYLVAGWVSQGNSPSATTAREWMGEQDWTHAPTVRFPLAVLAMFVTELSVGTSGEMPPLDNPLPTPSAADVQPASFQAGGFGRSVPLAVAPARLDGGPCTAVTQFISQSITGIFNALRITAPSGDGFFESIGKVLAGVVNFGLSLAKTVVEGLISAITAPVLNVIAIAVGALGVATIVASYFKDNTLNLRLAPPPPAPTGYRFAVDQEADISGEFVATGKELTGDWPPLLIDCAKAAGASLPELLPVGNAANWEVMDNGVITTGSRSGSVDADRSTRLRFTTGRESKEQAKGPELSNAAVATVRIPRKEVDSILDFARSKLNDAQSSILNKVPPAVRGAATDALNSVVNPTLNQIQGEISKTASGVFTLSGTTRVFVLHHGTPDTTTSSSIPDTTPPPDSSDEGDFCTQYLALVEFARSNQVGDVVAWATEIVNRLEAARPSAPAEFVGDVDIEIRVYSAVAASADVTVLIQTTEPLPAAAARLGTFCGVTG